MSLAFLVSACIPILIQEDTLSQSEPEEGAGLTLGRLLRDVLNAKYQWLIALGFVALHEIITFQVSYGEDEGGCPRGYLGPGGLHDGGKYQKCTGGVTGAVDRAVFGPNHMYNR